MSFLSVAYDFCDLHHCDCKSIGRIGALRHVKDETLTIHVIVKKRNGMWLKPLKICKKIMSYFFVPILIFSQFSQAVQVSWLDILLIPSRFTFRRKTTVTQNIEEHGIVFARLRLSNRWVVEFALLKYRWVSTELCINDLEKSLW